MRRGNEREETRRKNRKVMNKTTLAKYMTEREGEREGGGRGEEERERSLLPLLFSLSSPPLSSLGCMSVQLNFQLLSPSNSTEPLRYAKRTEIRREGRDG